MLANSNCMLYCYWSVGTAVVAARMLFRPTRGDQGDVCDGKFIGHYGSVDFMAIGCVIWLWQSE